MALYHGTSSKHLQSIIKYGLKPRGDQNSNWSTASQKQYVYLTSTYPLYFASQAVSGKQKYLIIEVDETMVDENYCYPDDDFIWWCYSKQAKNRPTLEEAGKLVQFNQNLWQKSLMMIGCIAYKNNIPFNAIKRILQIDFNKMNSQERMLFLSFIDVSVTPVAFPCRKKSFEKQLGYLFSEKDEWWDFNSTPDETIAQYKAMEDNRNVWSEIIYERKLK